jgi:thiopeptide-type bacteriocin biosynthesis protein
MTGECRDLRFGGAISGAGFFLLRTPTLPAEDFLNWTGDLAQTRFANVELDTNELESAWREDVSLLRERLKSLLDRAEIARAILIASPDLQSGIRYWRSDPDSKRGLQAERSLVRYFTRMCTRPTPFGLFAGCTLGRISKSETESSSLKLQPRCSYRTKTRLDYDYLFELTEAFIKNPAISRELKYWPNSSLHRCGSYWHYIEATSIGVEGSARSHQLVKVESSPYLEAILDKCSAPEGSSFSEILNTLTRDKHVSLANGDSYVRQAIESQLLVPALCPLATGDSALRDIIAQLRLLPSAGDVVSRLWDVEKQLANMDELEIGSSLDDYSREYYKGLSLLERLPAKVRQHFVYQIDMTKPSNEVVLTEPVLTAIREAVDATCRLSVSHEPRALRDFREAFMERYERDTRPLLEVLDEESGIGFGPPSASQSAPVKGLPLAEEPPSDRLNYLGPAHKFLLDRILKCFHQEASELRLDPSEIPDFRDKPLVLPTSLSVNIKLAASSSSALRAGDFTISLVAINAPAGARSLARFCHAEARLAGEIREYLRTEQLYEPNAVLAEIVHLPEGRFGNVLSRPVLREYEIVYLGRSGAPRDCQIPASDLLVTVNEREEICLVSQKLGRRVIPRLSSAQSFWRLSHAPVYRFLSYLQFQNGSDSLNFSWGPLDSLSFLPRVSVGRVVLAVARWRLRENEIKWLAEAAGWQRFARARELRKRRAFPRFVELVQPGELLLLVDFDNALSVDAFVHTLARDSEAVLCEMFPSPEELCVTSEEGRFWHDLDVPLINHATLQPGCEIVRASTDSITHAPQRVAPNRCAPGGEWLYLKLYGGWSTLDRILVSYLLPIIHRAIKESLIFRWFFVRYTDPRGHLRVRLHGEPARIHRDLLPLITATLKPLVDGRVIWKFQLDTYIREVQRYGGPDGILASEDIFRADSEAVLELLSLLDSTDDLDVRWRLALLGIDSLLGDCGFDLAQKLALVRLQKNSSYLEPQVAETEKSQVLKTARRILGDRFRSERSWFEAMRAGNSVKEPMWCAFEDVFRRRTLATRDAITHLQCLDFSGKLSRPMSALVADYVRMHVNRIMRSAAREHEFVLYDFLFRLYTADTVRAGTSPITEPTIGVSANEFLLSTRAITKNKGA